MKMHQGYSSLLCMPNSKKVNFTSVVRTRNNCVPSSGTIPLPVRRGGVVSERVDSI